MKRPWVGLGLAWAVMLGAHAAEAQEKRIGVFGGLNLATVVGAGADSIEGKEGRLGIHGGVSGEIGLSRSAALGAEILYTMRGVKGTSGDSRYSIAVDYIEIPVLVKGTFGPGAVRPFIFAGPALSIQVRCGASVTLGSATLSFDCDDPDLDASLRGTDVSILAGAGVRIGRAFVSARYDVGLANLNTSSNQPSNAVRSRTFSLSVGALFPVGTR